jgi:hypothetical protein
MIQATDRARQTVIASVAVEPLVASPVSATEVVVVIGVPMGRGLGRGHHGFLVLLSQRM